MAENSAIEWTTHTFNPWRGCTKVAAGCANCYADTLSKRNPGTLGIWGPNGTRVVASESQWRLPLKWNREAEAANKLNAIHFPGMPPVRPRVFCASLADVFEDWQGVMRGSKGKYLHHADRWQMANNNSPYIELADIAIGQSRVTIADVRRRLFTLIDATPNLDWLLLTKRPENIRRMWPYAKSVNGLCPSCKSREGVHGGCSCMLLKASEVQFRPNVWLGTSIATQADAEQNIPHLLKCRDLSPVLFISAEPLLGPVDIDLAFGPQNEGQWMNTIECGDPANKYGINWVIAGGESGPNARPMHPSWARSLRDQCQAAGVPFLFKQWGDWLPMSHGGTNGPYHEFSDGASTVNVGKKYAGRTIDGTIHDGYPKCKS